MDPIESNDKVRAENELCGCATWIFFCDGPCLNQRPKWQGDARSRRQQRRWTFFMVSPSGECRIRGGQGSVGLKCRMDADQIQRMEETKETKDSITPHTSLFFVHRSSNMIQRKKNDSQLSRDQIQDQVLKGIQVTGHFPICGELLK